MSENLFEQLVHITEDYLGPAARRFVARQISSHLGKEPEAIERNDIAQLAEWTKATLSLLTPDRRVVDEYTEKLLRLAGENGDSYSGNAQKYQVQ